MSDPTGQQPPTPNKPPPEYEIARHGTLANAWNVGHSLEDGTVQLTSFFGPEAEQRAREYGDWMAGKAGKKAEQAEGREPRGIRQEGAPERYGPTGQEPRAALGPPRNKPAEGQTDPGSPQPHPEAPAFDAPKPEPEMPDNPLLPGAPIGAHEPGKEPPVTEANREEKAAEVAAKEPESVKTARRKAAGRA